MTPDSKLDDGIDHTTAETDEFEKDGEDDNEFEEGDDHGGLDIDGEGT